MKFLKKGRSLLSKINQNRPSLRSNGLAKTEKGKVREQNEDAIYYGHVQNTENEESTLAIVADGMGGHNGGEIASKLAIDTIKELFSQSSQPLRSKLLDGFNLANQTIWQKSQENNELSGMGTTCSALVISGDKAFYAHIGDSRIYLYRKNQLKQITEDDTLINKLKSSGRLEEIQVNRNILHKAMGSQKEQTFQCPASPIIIQPNDRFLLCSDGLYDLISEVELTQILQLSSPLLAIQCFMALANDRGSHDNISIILLDVIEKRSMHLVTKEIRLS
jgi:protein phosphatase